MPQRLGVEAWLRTGSNTLRGLPCRDRTSSSSIPAADWLRPGAWGSYAQHLTEPAEAAQSSGPCVTVPMDMYLMGRMIVADWRSTRMRRTIEATTPGRRIERCLAPGYSFEDAARARARRLAAFNRAAAFKPASTREVSRSARRGSQRGRTCTGGPEDRRGCLESGRR